MKCPPTQPCFSGCCFRVLRPNKTQHIGPDRLVAEDSLCSLVPSRVTQQVPGVAGEDNCLSDHVISTLHTFCLSKCCQFLVSWGEIRLAFSNSHFSSQAYLDPLCLILSTTTPGQRESAYSSQHSLPIWGPRPSCMAATKPASPWK